MENNKRRTENEPERLANSHKRGRLEAPASFVDAAKAASKPKRCFEYSCGGAHPKSMPIADAIVALEAASACAAETDGAAPQVGTRGAVQHPPK